MPARSTAALIATAPRSLAASDAKSPWNAAHRRARGADDDDRIVQHRILPESYARACPFTSVSLNSSRPISIRRISRRAGADLVELGVAPQPAGRVFVDVAVAAEALDRLARHPRRLFRGVQDRAGRVLARRLAAVARLRRPRRRTRGTRSSSCTCRRACPASAGTRRSAGRTARRSCTYGSTASMHAAMMPSGPPASTARS